jgi:hypothetical protein
VYDGADKGDARGDLHRSALVDSVYNIRTQEASDLQEQHLFTNGSESFLRNHS